MSTKAGQLQGAILLGMDVIEQAAERERLLAGRWVWGWRRCNDARWPCFLIKREALAYMDDRLRRIAVFAR